MGTFGAGILGDEGVDVANGTHKKANESERDYTGGHSDRHGIETMPGEKHAVDEHLDRVSAGAEDEGQSNAQDFGATAGSLPSILQTSYHGSRYYQKAAG